MTLVQYISHPDNVRRRTKNFNQTIDSFWILLVFIIQTRVVNNSDNLKLLPARNPNDIWHRQHKTE